MQYTQLVPGDSKKLDKILDIVSDNNRMLHKMRRNAFWGTVFKVLFYAVAFGIPVYLYFTLLQPMLGNLIGTYEQIQQATGGAASATGAPLHALQGVLDSFLNRGL